MGDFNLHWNSDDPVVGIVGDSLNALGLSQRVAEPTHEAGNIIDYIICETEKVHNIWVSVGDYLSDHSQVNCRINISKPEPKFKRIIKRDWTKTTMKEMNEKLQKL